MHKKYDLHSIYEYLNWFYTVATVDDTADPKEPRIKADENVSFIELVGQVVISEQH